MQHQADGAAASRPRDRDPQARMVSSALREVQHASLEARQELARRLGLGINDVNALDHLVFSAEPIGPAELAALLGITTASATVLVNRLERAGHVRRGLHPTDRRRQTLAPTEHALAEVTAALEPLITALDDAAAGLSAAEAATVAGYLNRASVQLRRYAGHGGARGPQSASPQA